MSGPLRDFEPTMSSLEMVDFVSLERVCSFALSRSESAEDINYPLDAFETLVRPLPIPHPRLVVLLHCSLISLLSSARERGAADPSLRGVYAIEYSNGSVKIGCTAYFDGRLRQLSTQGGLTVARSKFFPCGDMFGAESVAHAEFKPARLNGEFFKVQFDQVLIRLAEITKER